MPRYGITSIRWQKEAGIRPIPTAVASYHDIVTNGALGGLLQGEVALITGGSRGIGLATAIAFARAGAAVALVARSADAVADAARAVRAVGGPVVARQADVVNEEAMANVVEEARHLLGPITILVNNAGSIGPIAPFGETALEEWWRCIEVNLRGPAVCTYLVIHDMVARGRGRIINVVSGAGAASFTYFSAYVASKTALVRWTESLAAELAPYGVHAFAMEPATVATDMSSFSMTSPEGRRWIPWFKGIFDAGLDVPVGRVADRALALAAGTSDPLSGRFIPLAEDLETLVANLSQIRREALYSLRLTRLPDAGHSSRDVALRAVRGPSEVASPSVIRLRRRLPVTPRDAFTLWCGDAVASWFIPDDGQWTESPTMEPEGGRAFSLRMSAHGESYSIYGTVVAAVSDTCLSLKWNWDSTSPILGSYSGTEVDVRFVRVDGGVDVVITHEGLPGEAVRDAYIRGWRRCLEGMDRLVHRRADPLRRGARIVASPGEGEHDRRGPPTPIEPAHDESRGVCR